MYEYKFSDGEKIKTSSDKLQEKVKNIDEKYKINLNYDSTADDTSIKLDRMEYKKPSENELSMQATDSLKSYKDSELKKINNNLESGTRKIDEQEKLVKTNYESSIQDIGESSEMAKETTKNRMLKKGLSHSSIMANSLKEIDDVEIKALESEKNTLSSSIEKLKIERDILQNEKEGALESFNIAYAVKLTEKINKLTEEASKKEKEVLDYNNKISQKEQDFILEQQKLNISQDNEKLKENNFILDYINKYGRIGLERLANEEKLSAAKDIISGMSKEDAFIEVENGRYSDILGDSIYKSLLNYIKDLP